MEGTPRSLWGAWPFFFLYILLHPLSRIMSRRTLYTPVLQDESLQVTMFFSTWGWLSRHRGPPANVPIRRTAHLFSVILANDTKESMFGHRNFSSPAAGMEPMTSSTEDQCFNHPCENKKQLCVKAVEKPAFPQLFCVFLRRLQKSCWFFIDFRKTYDFFYKTAAEKLRLFLWIAEKLRN